MDAKTIRMLALFVNLVSALVLIGILPQFGVSLGQAVFGAVTVGIVLGLAQLGVAYAIWKKRF